MDREQIYYQSTRGEGGKVTASQAILQGLAPDGGLYVPDHLPKLDVPTAELAKMHYREVAFEVLKLFLTDYTEEELHHCIDSAYDAKFDSEEIVPLKKADGLTYLELFHGATIAFKDMALSILPHLMTTAARKNGLDKEIVILTATSGDTGKAAMAGFADVPGTSIVVFYPKDGVSYVQKRQMITQKGANTCVIGINGNFDDAQRGVKEMFGDKALAEKLAAEGFVFSSANSINIGRLVPQVVYYVYGYAKMVAAGEVTDGEPIDICVPTGNFGNILAAHYAKCIGLPVRNLICASNDNKVLYDFFRTGTYDRNRDFILTISPSMDILISSNLERLIYESCGAAKDPAAAAAKNRALMAELSSTGKYAVIDEMTSYMKDFIPGFATEQETLEEIRKVYENAGYVIDTHTAVAAYAADHYVAGLQESGEKVLPVLVASTASPFKFSRAVMHAIDPEHFSDEEAAPEEEWGVVDALSALTGLPLPPTVTEARSAEVRHPGTAEVSEMQEKVEMFLKRHK